jgi:hypothetical protein
MLQAGTDCILDVCVTDTDARSHRKGTPFKVLELQDKNTSGHALRIAVSTSHLLLLVPSVDGLPGQEAKTFAKRLAAKLAGKWQKPCSQQCVDTQRQG